ncbi:MAG: peptidylprolyl isomerase [Bacteroidia bacterium]
MKNKLICRAVILNKVSSYSKTLLGFSLLIFINFIMSINSIAQPQVLDGITAIVGSKIIMQSEVDQQYQAYIAQGNYANPDMKCQLLDQMILTKMLLHHAILDSIEVTDDQVNDAMDRKFRYFIEQFGSVEKFEAYYGKPVLEWRDEIRPIMKDNLLMQAMRDKIIKTQTVSPAEVKQYFNNIPKDSLPLINAEVEYAQLVKNVPYSQASKAECRKQLEDYRQRVIKGESDFGTLAVLYSQDKGSAANNGELGFVNRGDLVAEFEAAAFKLQAGEVSPIVETKFGFHIIQLIERRGNQINVRHILLRPTISNEDNIKAIAYLDSIADLITKDSLSFTDASQRFSDDEDSRFSGGTVMNPKTGNARWEVDEIDRDVFFQVDQLQVGEFTKSLPYSTSQGKSAYRILMLRSRTKPHVLNMGDDYQRLQELALQDNQDHALRDWIKRKKGSTFIQINPPYKDCAALKDWNN